VHELDFITSKTSKTIPTFIPFYCETLDWKCYGNSLVFITKQNLIPASEDVKLMNLQEV